MKPDQDIYAPWEKNFNRVVEPFERFVHDESAGGLLLIAATLLALFFANTAMYATYHHVLEAQVGISIGGWRLEHSVHHWINEGLMSLFFFVVGLEIKREILVGELRDPKKALLPIIAAIGGMVVPALIYASLNFGGSGASGWGVPMATDIAFAVGILVLLGDRVPKTLLTFLVALAIVDDLGAVMVIAIFYTEQILWEALGSAALLFGILIIFNQFGIRKPIPYFIVGTLLWMAMLESGVHATLAGILTALTIPARPQYEPKRFVQLMRKLMDRFEQNCTSAPQLIGNEQQTALLRTLEEGVKRVETPLERLEHNMHIPVSFVIIPLFALANAGIPIHLNELTATFSHPITVGIMLGLLVGKLVGISALSLLAIRLGIAQFPDQTHTHHIIGVGFLGAIGFTMSIFISELGFVGMPQELIMAKTGILFASLIAGLVGFFWLMWTSKKAATMGQQNVRNTDEIS